MDAGTCFALLLSGTLEGFGQREALLYSAVHFGGCMVLCRHCPYWAIRTRAWGAVHLHNACSGDSCDVAYPDRGVVAPALAAPPAPTNAAWSPATLLGAVLHADNAPKSVNAVGSRSGTAFSFPLLLKLCAIQ